MIVLLKYQLPFKQITLNIDWSYISTGLITDALSTSKQNQTEWNLHLNNDNYI